MPLHQWTLIAGCIAAATSVAAVPPEPVEAPLPAAGPAETRADEESLADQERELVRSEFIEAREAFAKLLGAALSSEELAERAGQVSLHMQLRQAEDRLQEIETRLDEVDAAGRANSDEARRLRERVVSTRNEVARLRDPAAGPKAEDTASLATRALANRLHTSMAEETAYLADVLDNEELRQRTQRLHRLMAVSRFAAGLRAYRQNRETPRPTDEPPDKTPTVVPAGGTAEPVPADGSLGGATETPPTLPESP